MSNNAQPPFRFLSFKEWVPHGLRFWMYILFLVAFQFSNGMYFTAMSQMQGELSLTTNDVKMMSHAVLTGLTLFFPLAFRFKFRFTNRTSLIIAAGGLAACNLLVPHVRSLPLYPCGHGHSLPLARLQYRPDNLHTPPLLRT